MAISTAAAFWIVAFNKVTESVRTGEGNEVETVGTEGEGGGKGGGEVGTREEEGVGVSPVEHLLQGLGRVGLAKQVL